MTRGAGVVVVVLTAVGGPGGLSTTGTFMLPARSVTMRSHLHTACNARGQRPGLARGRQKTYFQSLRDWRGGGGGGVVTGRQSVVILIAHRDRGGDGGGGGGGDRQVKRSFNHSDIGGEE